MFESPTYIALIGFIAVNFMVAMSGAFFRPGAWYDTLSKPSWIPPNWLFGPVWMVLYGMNAVAGWLVWQKVGLDIAVFSIYAAQLLLNALWSALFFGMRRLRTALYEMMGLWLALVVNIAVFYPIDATAGLLIVPYLLWVSFAFFLNFVMVRLNPSVAT